MKKFAKMSLVAAVAVAGFSTTASAKALEDAIKNVDVSGTMVYRYDDRNKDGGNITQNNYKIGLNLKSKVNDDITANVRTVVGNADSPVVTKTDGAVAGTTTTSAKAAGADGAADVSVTNVYFSYTGIANTTVKVGKQGLTTPFTVAIDSMGNEQTGSGILALTNVGPVTFAAAYFNNHNTNTSGDYKTVKDDADTTAKDESFQLTDGSEDIMTIGAMANVGPVALDAWYLDLDETFSAYTIGASAKINIDEVKLSMGARHTALDFDKNNKAKIGEDKDNSLTKVNLGANMGIFGASVAYGWTDKDGGIAALDNDAKTAFQGWGLNLNGEEDASLLKTNLNVQVMPDLNVALNYNKLTRDTTDEFDAKEYYTQLTYKMSKNFNGYFRLGKIDNTQDTAVSEKGTRGRLHVTYSF